MRPVRYAVVGLGYIAQVAMLPAFRNAQESSRLVALVSGSRAKLARLGRRYGVDRLVRYSGYEELLRSGEVDAVYVALPNSMHRDATVQAAEAGVHVLCEKPLGVTSAECLEMIEAAAAHDVRLMTAYRLHFERANLSAAEVVASGRIGEPRFISASFSQQVAEGNVRLRADLGGGPLLDLGIYCLNAARAVFRDEPVEVTAFAARSADPRFREVEEMLTATLRFPRGRLASFTSSFGATDTSRFEVVGTKGTLCLDPAFEQAGALVQEITVDGRTVRREYPRRDQFAPELIHFSDCVRAGREPEPSGWEGLADVRVMEALLRSARTGRAVLLPPFARDRRPTLRQEMRRPGVRRPGLVLASAPGRDG